MVCIACTTGLGPLQAAGRLLPSLVTTHSLWHHTVRPVHKSINLQFNVLVTYFIRGVRLMVLELA